MGTNNQKTVNRRNFVRTSAGLVAGLTLTPALSFAEEPRYADEINIIGPIEGYSPQIGTFVSMLNWIRESVIRASRDLKTEELDFLMDPAKRIRLAPCYCILPPRKSFTRILLFMA